MAAPMKGDILLTKQQQGVKLATAFAETRRAIADGRATRENVIHAIGFWCAGLKEGEVAVGDVLLMLLDRVEAAGFEWHEVERFKADVLRALDAGLKARVVSEDVDVARGIVIEYADLMRRGGEDAGGAVPGA